jgi:hypothetical protein
MKILIQLQVTSTILILSLASIYSPAQSITANTLSLVQANSNQLVAKNRDLTDISIAGIKIGMTLQQVTNKLGKPSNVSQRADPCLGQKRITLRYNKLVITILGERVLQIENFNPLYQTGEKIKIGDSLSKAKSTYDKILSTPSSLNEESQELLYDKGADGILRFKSDRGKITSISIIVNDC